MKHKMTGNRAAMRRAFSFLLASVLVMSVLAGCGHAEPMTEAPPETAEDLAQDALLAGAGSTADAAAIGATAGGSEHAAKTEPDPNIDYTTGTPWLCSFLDGNVTADTPAPDLKDDFFLAVNKDDLASLQIPEGYSVCGTMYDVDMLADNDIKELFTDDSETDNDDAQLARLGERVEMSFWEKHADGRTVMRLATSWATRDEDVDALIQEMTQDEACQDIKTVKGHKDIYFYSDELMAHNYAKIAMLTLEKDDARTVAEMVRFNCKAFPTPTPVYYFARQPFFLDKERMHAVIAQMKTDDAYQDICECTADVNGEEYLYSSDLMSAKYAKALANGAESREADE